MSDIQASFVSEQERLDKLEAELMKRPGPFRNGCCGRGLMGVGMGCPDCPALDDPMPKTSEHGNR